MWEYYTEVFRSSINSEENAVELNKILDNAGAQNWELVSAVSQIKSENSTEWGSKGYYVGEVGTDSILLIFKRRKIQ